MAASPDYLRAQYAVLEKQTKLLLNADLKEICRREGLPISGIKAALQNRVLTQLRDLMNAPDPPRFEELRVLIQSNGRGASAVPSNSNGMPAAAFPVHQQPGYNPMATNFRTQALGPHGHAHQGNGSRLNFRPSPFWSLVEPLSPVVDLPLMGQARHTVTSQLCLSQPTLNRIRDDRDLRVMVFCAVDAPGVPHPSDIAFPAQVDLRVNSETYSGNLRGIKKKPGTTRPADITNLLRKIANYTNNISLVYQATDKKYAFVIFMVKKHSVTELVERVRSGHSISKESVLREMNEKAKDDDIETTSTVMSLKCPLSFMRLQLPCRSTICSHNQCFDASSFLEVQEQAPQWNCPICNKVFSFRDLVVDKYVQDILTSTSKSVDQVTIEPDGTWRQGTNGEDSRISNPPKRKATEAFEFEDLVEVTDPRSNGTKKDFSATPISYLATPSREVSIPASATGRSASSKRPAAQVVDLTLSDDDEPVTRPVKRQSVPIGFAPYSNGPPPIDRPPPFSFPIPQPPTHVQSPINPNPPGYPPGGYAWRQ